MKLILVFLLLIFFGVKLNAGSKAKISNGKYQDESRKDQQILYQKEKFKLPVDHIHNQQTDRTSVMKADSLPDFELIGNNPNPFNPITRIKYEIKKSGRITIEIFDVKGNKIKKLKDEFQEKGTYLIEWDGKNDYGIEMPAGLYLYSLRSKYRTCTRKMIMIK